MDQAIRSSMAGALSTIPMSMVIVALHRRLPRRERYPAPPREITDHIIDRIGLGPVVDDQTRRRIAWTNHFAYGSAMGAAFGIINPPRPTVCGVLFGLTIWTVSYLGWLPALHVLKPATKHPARRNAMMILAHAVWGIALGAVVASDKNNGKPRVSSLARPLDRKVLITPTPGISVNSSQKFCLPDLRRTENV